jgi:hypothetical protein
VPHYSYSEKYHNIDRAKINVQCLHIYIETIKKQRRSIVWHEAKLTHCDNKLTGIGGVSLRDLGVANLRAWMTLCSTENHWQLFDKITRVKQRLTLLKLLIKFAILITIVN